MIPNHLANYQKQSVLIFFSKKKITVAFQESVIFGCIYTHCFKLVIFLLKQSKNAMDWQQLAENSLKIVLFYSKVQRIRKRRVNIK